MFRKLLMASLFCCALPQLASAQFLVSTGLDPSNNLITTGGTDDGHWIVTQAAGGTAPAQVTTASSTNWWGGWLADGPNSDWITRTASNAGNGSDLYTWSTTFDLTGFNLSTASLSGSWAIDDSGVLQLNGNTIASLTGGQYGLLTPFSVAAGSPLFNQGLNTLSMTLNSNDNVFEAARLEGTVNAQASVPEPSSMVLAGLVGSLGLGYVWRDRRRKKAAGTAAA